MSYRCPQCKTRFERKGRFFPFCSERCKLGDLGAWASEKYVIAGDRKDSADETPAEESSSGERKS